jgi:hypothetical protein
MPEACQISNFLLRRENLQPHFGSARLQIDSGILVARLSNLLLPSGVLPRRVFGQHFECSLHLVRVRPLDQFLARCLRDRRPFAYLQHEVQQDRPHRQDLGQDRPLGRQHPHLDRRTQQPPARIRTGAH